MTDDEFVGHLPGHRGWVKRKLARGEAAQKEQDFVARVKAKVREKWNPAFVGQGQVDLGDGPYPGQEFKGRCSRCNTLNGVKWRFSRTAFEWDGKGANPNACIPMCDACADLYNKQMNKRWAEHFASQTLAKKG